MDTAERIVETARAILRNEGAGSVSMRRVAQEVGITPMAIYHHYANRTALLDGVLEREFAALAEQFTQNLAGRSPTERIHAALDLYVDFALGRPHVFDTMFLERRTNARRFPADFRRRKSPTMNILADLLTQAMNAGEIRPGDVWELTLDIWAHVHGYVALFRAGRFSLSEAAFRRLCRRSSGRFLDGLKP